MHACGGWRFGMREEGESSILGSMYGGCLCA